MSPGDASSSSAARRSALSRTFRAASRDRVAARHQRTAREGSRAPVEPARVPGHHRDVGGRAPQRVCSDLREGRLVALPLGREAGRHQDPAARLDPHVGTLVRPDPGPLHVAGDPEAQVASLRARRGLRGPELPRADRLERHLQTGRVVPAVVPGRPAVLERQAHVPRELVRLDEVPAAHLGGLETELARDEPDDALHHERPVGTPRPAVGRGHHLVRVQHVELDLVVADPVRAGKLGGRDERDHDAVRRVGPGVMAEPVPEPEDRGRPRRRRPRPRGAARARGWR